MRKLFHHQFEKENYTAVPWIVGAAGTLALDAAADRHLTGGQSMSFTTSTTVDQVCSAHLFMAREFAGGAIAFGGRFATLDENPLTLSFSIIYRDGTNRYTTRLLHTYSTNVWSRLDAAGAEQGVLTQDPSEATTPHWHKFMILQDPNDTQPQPQSIGAQIDYAAYNTPHNARLEADTANPNLVEFRIETVNIGAAPSAGVILFDELWACSGGPHSIADAARRFYG